MGVYFVAKSITFSMTFLAFFDIKPHCKACFKVEWVSKYSIEKEANHSIYKTLYENLYEGENGFLLLKEKNLLCTSLNRQVCQTI